MAYCCILVIVYFNTCDVCQGGYVIKTVFSLTLPTVRNVIFLAIDIALLCSLHFFCFLISQYFPPVQFQIYQHVYPVRDGRSVIVFWVTLSLFCIIRLICLFFPLPFVSPACPYLIFWFSARLCRSSFSCVFSFMIRCVLLRLCDVALFWWFSSVLSLHHSSSVTIVLCKAVFFLFGSLASSFLICGCVFVLVLVLSCELIISSSLGCALYVWWFSCVFHCTICVFLPSCVGFPLGPQCKRRSSIPR